MQSCAPAFSWRTWSGNSAADPFGELVTWLLRRPLIRRNWLRAPGASAGTRDLGNRQRPAAAGSTARAEHHRRRSVPPRKSPDRRRGGSGQGPWGQPGWLGAVRIDPPWHLLPGAAAAASHFQRNRHTVPGVGLSCSGRPRRPCPIAGKSSRPSRSGQPSLAKGRSDAPCLNDPSPQLLP